MVTPMRAETISVDPTASGEATIGDASRGAAGRAMVTPVRADSSSGAPSADTTLQTEQPLGVEAQREEGLARLAGARAHLAVDEKVAIAWQLRRDLGHPVMGLQPVGEGQSDDGRLPLPAHSPREGRNDAERYSGRHL